MGLSDAGVAAQVLRWDLAFALGLFDPLPQQGTVAV